MANIIEDAKNLFDEVQKKEPMMGLGSYGMSALSRIPFVIHPTIHVLMVDFAGKVAMQFDSWRTENYNQVMQNGYDSKVIDESVNYQRRYTRHELFEIYLKQKK